MLNWLRDSLSPEEREKMNFDKKKLKDKEIIKLLPNNMIEFLNLIEGFEESVQKDYMHKEIKNHYLWPFFEATKGVAANLASKLIFQLKDLDRYPTVSHLWSYCGLDGPDWRSRSHNHKVTPICYLIAAQFVKQGDKYREIYERRKELEAAKPPCSKCLELGLTESCTPKHIDLRARRYTVKQFLKDLWVYNRELQKAEQGEGESS
jgi:hypothetical protein